MNEFKDEQFNNLFNEHIATHGWPPEITTLESTGFINAALIEKGKLNYKINCYTFYLKGKIAGMKEK